VQTRDLSDGGILNTKQDNYGKRKEGILGTNALSTEKPADEGKVPGHRE